MKNLLSFASLKNNCNTFLTILFLPRFFCYMHFNVHLMPYYFNLNMHDTLVDSSVNKFGHAFKY